MSTASLALVTAALPAFLVGGLAVQVRADLGLSELGLGAAVSAAFITGAASAPFVGRIADRLGARAALTLGAAFACISLGGIATAAHAWWQLTVFLAIGGMSIATTDPGIAVMVSQKVRPTRQGLAFGIKEASIPLASLIAGVTVPLIALSLGWRWAFATAAIPVLMLVFLLKRIALARPAVRSTPRSHARGIVPSRSTLLLVGGATSMGITAASGVGVFLTQSAVAMGTSAGTAGILLAVGGAAGIATRLAVGIAADRSGRGQFRVIAGMLVVGAMGMLAGATGVLPLLVVAAISTFSAGWGWTGLLVLSLVRAMPGSPGAAAGVGVAGLASGNAFGPLVFGALAGAVSYRAAWFAAATLAACAATLMMVVSKKLVHSPAGA